MAEGSRRALEAAGEGAALWLENTAGGGGHLGGDLGQLALLLERLEGMACGVVIDTAHAFAAGYVINGFDQTRTFVSKLDAELGLERVKMWHLNDTDFPAGSRRDRHAHLGKGLLGEGCFAALMSDVRLAGMGGVMETPKDTRWADRRNLAFLRRLRRRGARETVSGRPVARGQRLQLPGTREYVSFLTSCPLLQCGAFWWISRKHRRPAPRLSS